MIRFFKPSTVITVMRNAVRINNKPLMPDVVIFSQFAALTQITFHAQLVALLLCAVAVFIAGDVFVLLMNVVSNVTALMFERASVTELR